MSEKLVTFLYRLRNRHFFAIDLLVFSITPALALFVRVKDVEELSRYSESLILLTSVFALIKVAVFYHEGLYSRYWRYASIDEAVQIGLSVLFAGFGQYLAFFVLLRPLGLVEPSFPRLVPLIDGIATLLIFGGVRFSVRLGPRLQQRSNHNGNAERVIIAGAGEAGVMIAREIESNPSLGLQVAAFVDDDPAKHRSVIRGITVMGDRHQIPQLVRDTRARRVIIAMPTAAGQVIRQILAICERAGVKAQTIPGMYELLDGTVSVGQLRDVAVEDLLRREPVQTDVAAVNAFLRGKRVLVTGGGGSIGGELCRQILRAAPAQLVLLGHGENSIFEITRELRDLAQDGTVVQTHIADIRFPGRLGSIFAQCQPQIVFHAAAHKHVPLMEANPCEAISNNVLGTRYLLDASLAAGVEHFVLISTDKAVNPTSVMGASKRVAELLVHRAAQQSGRAYVAVRFGNVLGSRGSVVPTFQKQIAAGGPVTVTDPEMKRFFMTIPEAVQLVLQATVLGTGGEVFVLDMGEPVKIVDLASDVIELSGLEVGKDIDIVFTGMRPGEKLVEELFVAGEDYERTQHDKILIARHAGGNNVPDLDAGMGQLQAAARRNDTPAIIAWLAALVPEYRPNGHLPPAPPAPSPLPANGSSARHRPPEAPSPPGPALPAA